MFNLVNDIYSRLDRGDLYFSMFLDLRKAFDSVSHDILLSKMYHYGVRGVPLAWLRSYLSNRTQCVALNGVSSVSSRVTCGVPQGSVVGGLLFLIFFNDFPNCSKYFKFTLFADDSTLSCDFPRDMLNVVHHDLNDNLVHVGNWLINNKTD